jgi:hypothetical protein
MNNSKLTSTRKEVRIDSLSDFTEWTRTLRKFSLNNELKTYTFNLTEFSVEENQRISGQVTEYHNACGCNTGSLTMTITLVSAVSYFFISGGTISTLSGNDILLGSGITIAGALVGKAIGLLQARWKLIRLAQHLQQQLQSVYTRQIASF